MSSKKDSKEYPPAQKIELYEKLIRACSQIERKGDTVPYTSMNGHMFSFLDKKGVLVLRLSPEDRQPFIDKFKTFLSEQYGVVMKEWVTVPDSLLEDMKTMKNYLELSIAYVMSLKPKRGKKEAKKKLAGNRK